MIPKAYCLGILHNERQSSNEKQSKGLHDAFEVHQYFSGLLGRSEFETVLDGISVAIRN